METVYLEIVFLVNQIKTLPSLLPSSSFANLNLFATCSPHMQEKGLGTVNFRVLLSKIWIAEEQLEDNEESSKRQHEEEETEGETEGEKVEIEDKIMTHTQPNEPDPEVIQNHEVTV